MKDVQQQVQPPQKPQVSTRTQKEIMIGQDIQTMLSTILAELQTIRHCLEPGEQQTTEGPDQSCEENVQLGTQRKSDRKPVPILLAGRKQKERES